MVRLNSIATLLSELRASGIYAENVLAAIERTKREQFVPPELASQAYQNRALPIGFEQTISQPYIVALMTEALGLLGEETVLEIGTGCGYQTAVLAQLAKRVISMERLPQLNEAAQKRLAQLGYQNIEFHLSDGSYGWEKEAPYEAILVTAAAPEIPSDLINQLSEGGRMVIPVGKGEIQILYHLTRHGDELLKKELCRCRFVPLIREEGWFSPNFSS